MKLSKLIHNFFAFKKNKKGLSNNACGNTLPVLPTNTIDAAANIHSMTWGIFFKNSSKRFTKKHDPSETQFISLPHTKPPLACARDESYKLSVTSALPWNQTKSQMLLVCFFFLPAAALRRPRRPLTWWRGRRFAAHRKGPVMGDTVA